MELKKGSFVHITRTKAEQNGTYIKDRDGHNVTLAALPRVGIVTFISSKREWAAVLLYTDTRPYRALYRESFALDKLNAVRRPQGFPNNA